MFQEQIQTKWCLSAFLSVPLRKLQRNTVYVCLLSPLNYLAATTMDWCWPRSVRQWGTPHSSSLSSIWEIKAQMESDCRKYIFLKVKQWTEQAFTIGEKKTKSNVHKQQFSARYWEKDGGLQVGKTISKFCNNLLNQKHGFVCFVWKKRKTVVLLSEEWLIIQKDMFMAGSALDTAA